MPVTSRHFITEKHELIRQLYQRTQAKYDSETIKIFFLLTGIKTKMTSFISMYTPQLALERTKIFLSSKKQV